jgi:hypothetical protein
MKLPRLKSTDSLILLMFLLLLALGGGASAAVRYVDVNSPRPTPPYTNWATAAAVIQDAVDAAAAGDEIVVTNGIYATGGRAVGTNLLVNRVAMDKAVVLRSVNGPGFTTIQGYPAPVTTNGDSAIRCVYLADGAVLSGFTLTNGATRLNGGYDHDEKGGGLWCESTNATAFNCILSGNSAGGAGGAYSGTLQNCTLSSNWVADCGHGGGEGGGASLCILNNCSLSANSACLGGGASESTLNNCKLNGNSAGYGGGAHSSTLNNCLLTENAGGGADFSTLNNCLVTGNSSGGGATSCTLNNCTLTANVGGGSPRNPFGGAAPVLYNCIVYYNVGPNYDTSSSLTHCCTTPQPTNGWGGNITNEPLFIDSIGGNLRLQTNSPCINAGDNVYVVGTTDLDGRPRIVGGTVDIGAYEFQRAGMGEFIGWLQSYGLPTDGSADFIDSDGDGMNNWQEWRCGTNPTNALSVLRLLSAVPTGADVTVTWQSVPTINYVLERSTNLGASPPFTSMATNVVGLNGTTSYTDTNAATAPTLFYRVGVGDRGEKNAPGSEGTGGGPGVMVRARDKSAPENSSRMNR